MFSFFISTVKANLLRNCSNYRFCTEAINREPLSWSLNPQPLSSSSTFRTYSIIQQGLSYDLSFTITLHQTGFNFHVNFPDFLNSYRYNLLNDTDVFVNQPKNLTFTTNSNSIFDEIHPDNAQYYLKINFVPFTIDFLNSKSQKYLTLNGNQLLHIENGDHVNSTSETINNITYTDTIPNGKTGVSLDFSFPRSDVHLSGIAEKFIQFNLDDTPKEEPMRHFNHDSHSNYGYIPIIYSHYSNSSQAAAVFFANPSDNFISITTHSDSREVRFIAEGGHLDFIIFCSDSGIIPIIESFTYLTGRPPLPPAFSFGNHQSKWGYYTQKIAEGVIDNYTSSNIPFDVLWLDVDHLKDNAPMHFDPERYPHPDQLISKLASQKRFLVRLNDPHLPTSPEIAHPEYNEAHKNGYLVQLANGSELNAPCWPGISAYPDYFRPEVKMWWASLFQPEKTDYFGKNVFFWNDMNEPAVFDTPDGTFFKDALHIISNITIEHREVHSLYGLKMVSATNAGLLQRDHTQRPFILSRSFFAGSQKYAWIWTGDNTADWENLRLSIHEIQTLSICGMPYSGCDLGGFFNNPTDELITRWYQNAVWCYPFFRSHSNFTSDFREPFLWNSPTKERLKAAIEDRYMMLPIWMKAAKETSQTGVGPILPLFAEFPGENLDIADENIILAHSILVAPVLSNESTNQNKVMVYKPPGIWYNKKTGETLFGSQNETLDMDSIPIFFKGGEIITMFNQSALQTTDQLKMGLALYICLNENQSANGKLYIDDGKTIIPSEDQVLEASISFTRNPDVLVVNTSKKNDASLFKDTMIRKLIFYGLKSDLNLNLQGAVYQTQNSYLIVNNISLSMSNSFIIEEPEKRKKSNLALILGITIPLVILALIGILLIVYFRMKKLKKLNENEQNLPLHEAPVPI